MCIFVWKCLMKEGNSRPYQSSRLMVTVCQSTKLSPRKYTHICQWLYSWNDLLLLTLVLLVKEVAGSSPAVGQMVWTQCCDANWVAEIKQWILVKDVRTTALDSQMPYHLRPHTEAVWQALVLHGLSSWGLFI